ncbi:P-loop containing nucleoside triphosphate hydrolase protein [Astrocystis sublimbata]|nr:P-loop containing nucleoside triphosphate hydrolase protein [Astrocystis sublimbata]
MALQDSDEIIGKTTLRSSNKPKPTHIIYTAETAGSDRMAGGKHRIDEPPLSAQQKRQKREEKKINDRKVQLEGQLGNLVEPISGQQYQSSDAPEDTPAQRKRDLTTLNEALLVEGMKSYLRDYQVSGAAFMLRRERMRGLKDPAKHENMATQPTDRMEEPRRALRGGILADEMGIGKTVQAIACMVANPPGKAVRRNHQGATLIVVPNQGLVEQWHQELLRHANFSEDDVVKYTGGMKRLSITAFQVVLATYSQMEREFRLQSSGSKKDSGALFSAEFYRIILDEGDSIRNRKGSTSRACCQLRAQLRWILSGTPLRNECLPYFDFFGIDPTEEYEQFNGSADRMMQILAHIMYRRESTQDFLGRKICQLPEHIVEDKVLRLTDEEMTVARFLEEVMLRIEAEIREKKKIAAKNKKAGRQPEIKKLEHHGPISNPYLRTTRLRQSVDHIFLLEKCIKDTLDKADLESLIAKLRQIDIAKVKARNETASTPPEGPKETSALDVVTYIIAHLDDTLYSQNNDGCLECSSVSELRQLQCGHVLCRNCYRGVVDNAYEEGKRQCKCPQCGKTFAGIKEDPDRKELRQEIPAKLTTESFRYDNGRGFSVVVKKERSQRSPGDDHNGMQPQMSMTFCRWLEKCDKENTITPSTKLTAAIKIVNDWQTEAPDDKIVIFTEWIGTAKILGRMLNKEKIEFVYYCGSGMTVLNRATNLDDFKTNHEIKVMISTMGAGNVGLNVTEANRMIIMNPWWNCAAESQAFGRLKRHGQSKKTYLIRLFAEDTIDDRIRAMQAKKTSEIKEAMAHGRKPKPLKEREYMWLMGDRDAFESPFDDSDEEALSGDESDSGSSDSKYSDSEYSDSESSDSESSD